MFKIFTTKISEYKAQKAAEALEKERLKQTKLQNEKTIRLMQIIVASLLVIILGYALLQQTHSVKEFVAINTLIIAFPLVLYAVTIIWLETMFGLVKTLVFLLLYATIGIFFLPFILLVLLVVDLLLKELVYNTISAVVGFFIEALFD